MPGLEKLCLLALHVPLGLAHIGHEKLRDGQIIEIFERMRIHALAVSGKPDLSVVERPDVFLSGVIHRHVFVDRARTVGVIPPEERGKYNEVLLYRELAE